MKSEDKKYQRIMEGFRKGRGRGDHPAEAKLAALVEGRLSEAETDGLAGHLARCPVCLASVMMLRSLQEESAKEARVEVPASLLARVKKHDPARKGLMEVVVNFVRGKAEIERMSELVTGSSAPAPAPVRREGKVVSETLVTFTKEFPPYLAEIDVEKVTAERGEITVRLADQSTSSAPSGVRVSLFDRGTELESAMLEDGAAVFENVKFGEYHLEITRVGEPVGRVTLEMKGDGK